MWFASEARQGSGLTLALRSWGWGDQGGRARGDGVARPHPLEQDAQPYECDQHELVEEKMRHHGKTPSYTCCNEGIVPGLAGCRISRRLQVHYLSVQTRHGGR